MRNGFWALSLIVVSLSLSGCGSAPESKREPVYPVSGKVTYKGQPVADADVVFFCKEKNISSFAKTNEEGKFKLTTFASFDGAPAGKHIVTVSKLSAATSTAKDVDVTDPAYDPIKLVEGDKNSAPKNLIPAKYADVQSTDLLATVTPDNQTPEVELNLQD